MRVQTRIRLRLTGAARAWLEVGHNKECDTRNGEVYRRQSPGKVQNLDRCKMSCQIDSQCQSITYFNGGWCSHFSTPCTNVKWKGNAVALRLVATITSTTTITTTSTTPNPNHTWVQIVKREKCDTDAGEVYREQQSPGKVADLNACKSSCVNDAGCKSITFFKDKWCSHFGTLCTKTVKARRAKESWRLLR